jgi:hypothetical protein
MSSSAESENLYVNVSVSCQKRKKIHRTHLEINCDLALRLLIKYLKKYIRLSGNIFQIPGRKICKVQVVEVRRKLWQ